jgi:hypothetical protein
LWAESRQGLSSPTKFVLNKAGKSNMQKACHKN